YDREEYSQAERYLQVRVQGERHGDSSEDRGGDDGGADADVFRTLGRAACQDPRCRAGKPDEQPTHGPPPLNLAYCRYSSVSRRVKRQRTVAAIRSPW